MSFGAFLQRRRVAISYVFAAVYLLTARPVPGTVAVGALLMTAGAAFRTWSSGHIRKQKKLAVSGPYAHTRNPLYLGSFAIAAGALVMGANWWIALLFTFFAVPLYLTVMKREEGTLEEKFGEDFRKYRSTVPLFFPRFSGESAPGSFEWQLVWKHREWQVWLGAAALTAYMIAFYIISSD